MVYSNWIFSTPYCSFHMCYLVYLHRALARFDEADFSGVKEYLELVSGASLTNNKPPELGIDVDWDPQSLLLAANKQFIRAATLSTDRDSKLALPDNKAKTTITNLDIL